MSADDIVTRLRRMDASIPSVDPDKYVSPTEAADEIERLRAEDTGLRIRIYTLLEKLDEYEQAVRDAG